MSSFTVALQSRLRISGTPNSYSLQLPALPKGYYKALFSILCNQATLTELCVRWPGQQRHFQVSTADSFAIALSFDVYEATGVLYVQDPDVNADVLFRVASNGAVSTTMLEHTIQVHFEAVV